MIRDLAPASDGTGRVQVFGRLQPGIAPETAAEEATTIFSAIRKAAAGPDATSLGG